MRGNLKNHILQIIFICSIIVELYIQTKFGPTLVVQAVTPVEPLLERIKLRVYCPSMLILYACSLLLLGETIMDAKDIIVWNH